VLRRLLAHYDVEREFALALEAMLDGFTLHLERARHTSA
jgi:hypothetical protein